MRDYTKADVTAPRHRAKRLNTGKEVFLSKVLEHPDCLVKDMKKIKQIINAAGKAICDTIVNTRDGIELPEQLGYMFLGTCQPKIRKNVDFATSSAYLKIIEHRNWESDSYLAKIFYTNYETKYKFKYNDLWGLKACRNLTHKVGQEYPKKWKMYIQVDHTLKVARLFRDFIYNRDRESLQEAILETYDPLEID